jgi:hypothetical protein
MEEVGIRFYHTLNSPTIIDTKRVSRWRHLRCYMVVGAGHYYFEVRLENRRVLDMTCCKKLRDKFGW